MDGNAKTEIQYEPTSGVTTYGRNPTIAGMTNIGKQYVLSSGGSVSPSTSARNISDTGGNKQTSTPTNGNIEASIPCKLRASKASGADKTTLVEALLFCGMAADAIARVHHLDLAWALTVGPVDPPSE